MTKIRTISKWFLALFMVGAGTLHFIKPDFYLKIMPPYLPLHLELVYLSGFFEIALGFPVNIYVYLNQDLLPAPPILHLMRLPLQGVFILWAYWHTTRGGESG
jgi:uncharacterized membrane protein